MVAARREELQASARAETITHLNNNSSDYIITTTAEDDTTMSSLTPSPAKRSTKKITNKMSSKVMVAALNGVKEGLGEFVNSTTTNKRPAYLLEHVKTFSVLLRLMMSKNIKQERSNIVNICL